MPFQDIDEVSIPESRRTSAGVERVIRKLFVEDWNLKLLALAITLVLWLLVTSQNQPVTAYVNVQLNFMRPPALDLSNDPPKTVEVMLTGSRSKLDNLGSLDLVANIDITDQRAGERVLRLADKAQIMLPQGVKIDGFQPSAIPIRLEPIVQKQIEVEAKVEGKPADGYEVYAVRPSKSVVSVRGPASHVNALQKALTETIWLTGQKATFTATNLAIDVSDPKVDLLDPVVDVEIEIGERRVEKSFSGIPVSTLQGSTVQPSTATAIVTGPASVLETLKPQDLKIVVSSSDKTIQPAIELAPALQGKVSLKSVQPAKFVQVR
jgi:YbbR domain-containing protein